jgi:hypothetical protein
MANDFLILGNSATSGSFITNNSILFSTFGNATNFEIPDFVASASFEIATLNVIVNSDDATELDNFSTDTYNNVIYDYGIRHQAPGTGARTGQFYIVHDDDTLEYTDTSTPSLHSDSSEPYISASISGNTVTVYMVDGNGYIFKAFAKKL